MTKLFLMKLMHVSVFQLLKFTSSAVKSQPSLENAGVLGPEFMEKTKAGDLVFELSCRPGEELGLLLLTDRTVISLKLVLDSSMNITSIDRIKIQACSTSTCIIFSWYSLNHFTQRLVVQVYGVQLKKDFTISYICVPVAQW